MNIISIFSVLLLIGVSPIFAQEQMTNFQGDPCCFNAQHLFNYGEHSIAIAKDHQEGVRIYELLNDKTDLLFSNVNDNKYTLYGQGLRSEFYYLIYNDRIELFYFDSLHLKTYDFPEPLEEVQAGEGGGLRMTDLGLLIIPKNRDGALQFFDFESQKFDDLTNTIDRNDYAVFVDSFMYFTNLQDEFVALLSHNLLTNESQKLYTASSTEFEFQAIEKGVYFRDGHNVLVTKGRPSNTHFLFERESTHDQIEFFSDQSDIAFLTYGNEEQIDYYKFDDSGQLLSEIFLPFTTSVVITDFRLTANKEIVFTTAINVLYATRGSKDTIVRIDEFDQYDVALDAHLVYYVKANQFWSYNTLTQDRESISPVHQFGLLYNLVLSSNGLLYWLGKSGGSSVGVTAFNLGLGEFLPVLELGEFNDGVEDMAIKRVGDYLFLRGPNIPVHVFIAGLFQKLGDVTILSNIIQFKGRYYVVGVDQNLYEWNESKGLTMRIENLPIGDDFIELSVRNGQLFASDKESVLIQLKLNEQEYEELLPNIDYEIQNVIAEDAWYFVCLLRTPDQSREIWSYDIEKRQWIKLFDNGAQFIDQLGEVTEILNERFIWSSENIQEINLNAIHLNTTEQEVLQHFNFSDQNAELELFSRCDKELVLYFYPDEFYFQRLYVTDGNPGNTKLLNEVSTHWGFQIPYIFDDHLYFSAVDSFNTTVFSYKCLEGTLHEQNWSVPLITQGQYKLRDRIFLLGNQRFPRQNLTVAELQQDQIIEIAISPDDFGFFGRSNGQIRSAVPVSKVNDSTLAIVASFDQTGEELWFLESNSDFYRKTDLNTGPFDAQIREMTVHEGYLYFTGYKYGPGEQVWRIPVKENMTSSSWASSKRELLIAPNPVHSNLRIENFPIDQAFIRIFNSTGKLVYHVTIAGDEQKPVIEMGGLPEGLYFLHLQTNQAKYYATVIKVD